MGRILNSTSDYNAIRSYLGVDSLTLPDWAINTVTFLPVAEATITKIVKRQEAYGVLSVTQIMALDEGEPDQVFLKAAVAAYCAYLFTPGSTNAVNTSVTDGEQTVDLGGIGAQWIEQGQYAFQQCGFYLSQLENWYEEPGAALVIGGPTSSRLTPDTLGGFF